MERGGDPGPSASIVATASSRWSQFEQFEAAVLWFGGSGAPAEEVKPAAFSRGVGQHADARADPLGEIVLLALKIAEVAIEASAPRGVLPRGHPQVPVTNPPPNNPSEKGGCMGAQRRPNEGVLLLVWCLWCRGVADLTERC